MKASTSNMDEADNANPEVPPRKPRLFPLLFLALSVIIAGVVVIALRHHHRHRPEPPPWPGWLDYTVIPSPNFNQRPPGEVVNCIVLHSTAQPLFTETIKRFQDPETKVSAHFVVDRDGTVIQMVPLTERAWHAGVSEWKGVAGVNDYSIGIEMTNDNDGKDPYPLGQYKAVAEIIRKVRQHYSIPDNRIVSHAEIALPPGRKTDPRGFSFPKLLKMLDKPEH